jgi:hypothetical protein
MLAMIFTDLIFLTSQTLLLSHIFTSFPIIVIQSKDGHSKSGIEFNRYDGEVEAPNQHTAMREVSERAKPSSGVLAFSTAGEASG